MLLKAVIYSFISCGVSQGKAINQSIEAVCGFAAGLWSSWGWLVVALLYVVCQPFLQNAWSYSLSLPVSEGVCIRQERVAISALLSFHRFNHRDPCCVSAAFEFGIQKRINNIQYQTFANDAYANG